MKVKGHEIHPSVGEMLTRKEIAAMITVRDDLAPYSATIPSLALAQNPLSKAINRYLAGAERPWDKPA